MSRNNLTEIIEFLRESETRTDIDPATVGHYRREFKVLSLHKIASEICGSIFEGSLTAECTQDGVDIYRTATLPDSRELFFELFKRQGTAREYADVRLSIIIADDWNDELFNIIPDGIEGETDAPLLRPSLWKAAFLDEMRVHPKFKELFGDWLSKEHLDHAIPIFRGEVIHPAVLAEKEEA